MTALQYCVVFFISAAILACEIFLMGLFSLIQWHHFASMIISVALLGFGVSGTMLAIWREQFVANWPRWFHASAIVFLGSVCAALWLLPWVPFNPFRLPWDAGQLLHLLTYYLLLLIPFTAGATVIGLAFLKPDASIPRVYCANLLGSGLGVAVGLLLGYLPLNVPLSEYKGLSKCLLLPEAHIVNQEGHPLGRMDVVSAPALRIAPGLSLAYRGPMPKQEAIFVNGDGPSAVIMSSPRAGDLAFLEWMPTALPYRMLREPAVLVIGAGGGLDVLQAIRLSGKRYSVAAQYPSPYPLPQGERGPHGVPPMSVAPISSPLAGEPFDSAQGPGPEPVEGDKGEGVRSIVVGIEAHPRVARYIQQQVPVPLDLRITDARAFVRSTKREFDLIQISLLESFGTASAGIQSTHENYLYTVEAFQDYLRSLNEGGMLAVTRWLKTPPRDEIRLFATAVTALEKAGSREPGDHLVFVRGLQTGTLLVKRTPFEQGEVEAAKLFCEERLFDLDHFPGIREPDANRFNRVADNLYFHAFQRVLFGDREGLFAEYLFDVRPTTDDQPFFSQFFRWEHAGRLWGLLKKQALPLMELGYVVQFATLLQALVLSVVLIGLPLLLGKWGNGEMGRWGGGEFNPEAGPPPASRSTLHASRFAAFFYFACLGLGFMLLEMALMQKFVLFLAHPIYSASVVIAAFLVFAGLGSATAWMRSPFAPLCGIVAVGALELVFLPKLFSFTLAAPGPARVLVVVAAVAPLGFLMGMPFPLALRRLSEEAPSLVPWAWGINGCLSVVAVNAAPLLAIHFGFNAVIAAGLLCYLAAALVCERRAD